MTFLFGALTLLYIYVISKNSVEWVTYSNNYKNEYKYGNGTETLNATSIKGWYL